MSKSNSDIFSIQRAWPAGQVLLLKQVSEALMISHPCKSELPVRYRDASSYSRPVRDMPNSPKINSHEWRSAECVGFGEAISNVTP